MGYFQGKTAVVTGGASGIGYELSKALLAGGARVVIADIEQAALDRACAELGVDVTALRTDVTAPAALEALAEFTWARHGGCDLLFNNAGVGIKEAQRRLWTLPPEDWNWGVQVNFLGAVNGVRAFVPRMLAAGRPGHIINTSSSNGGLASLPTTPIYASTKAALTSMTEVLNYQLQMDKSLLQAHLLFPGPNLVNTNILNSERSRPQQLRGADAPLPGYASMKELAEKSGINFQLTEPADVAAYCLRGIEQGQFWIMHEAMVNDTRLERRTQHIQEQTRPSITEFQ